MHHGASSFAGKLSRWEMCVGGPKATNRCMYFPGSGAISLALLKARPQWRCTGIDVSEEAVSLTSINSQRSNPSLYDTIRRHTHWKIVLNRLALDDRLDVRCCDVKQFSSTCRLQRPFDSLSLVFFDDVIVSLPFRRLLWLYCLQSAIRSIGRNPEPPTRQHSALLALYFSLRAWRNTTATKIRKFCNLRTSGRWTVEKMGLWSSISYSQVRSHLFLRCFKCLLERCIYAPSESWKWVVPGGTLWIETDRAHPAILRQRYSTMGQDDMSSRASAQPTRWKLDRTLNDWGGPRFAQFSLWHAY